MKNLEKFVLYGDLYAAEKSVRLACEQMILLYEKLEGLKKRYQDAIKINRRSMRYPLRMRIVTVEGFINLYYEYTKAKQVHINEIRRKLYGEEVSSEDDDETDYEDSDDFTAEGE